MKTSYKLFGIAFLIFFGQNSNAQLTQPMNFPLPSNVSAANITQAEYYFDNDSGYGNGNSIPLTSGNNISINNFSVSINTLTTGVHRMYLRTKNINGSWSLNNIETFFIIPQSVLFPANQNIVDVTGMEYFMDNDPGFGNGTPISIAGGSDVSANNIAIPIDTLSAGVHRIYVRSKNANNIWSLTNVNSFFIIPSQALFPANFNVANVTTAEYFLDNDPGFGNETAIPIAVGTDVSANNVAIPIDTLSAGVHRIYVRTKNANNTWSMTNVNSFFIIPPPATLPDNASLANVTAAEYFIDHDPGIGNGTNILVSSGSDISLNNVAISIDTLSVGVHRIYVRTKNTNNIWSITNTTSFYLVPINYSIPSNPNLGNITAIEYFFDHDPGFGNGTMISIPSTTNLVNYSVAVDISSLQNDTVHTLYIRTLDGWSQTTTTTFAIGTVLPLNWLIFSGKLQENNNVLLQWQTAAGFSNNYFDVEKSRNGINFNKIGEIFSVKDNSIHNNNYQFIDTMANEGMNYYRIKAVDFNGKTSYSAVLPININSYTNSDFYVLNNPAHDILKVHIGENTAPSLIRIFDLNGKLKISHSGQKFRNSTN